MTVDNVRMRFSTTVLTFCLMFKKTIKTITRLMANICGTRTTEKCYYSGILFKYYVPVFKSRAATVRQRVFTPPPPCRPWSRAPTRKRRPRGRKRAAGRVCSVTRARQSCHRPIRRRVYYDSNPIGVSYAARKKKTLQSPRLEKN